MAVIREETYFMSTTGQHKIRCLIWQDDVVAPIALLQIMHGVSEHIERYDEFARYLASNGFVVFGNDHLGHGKSIESIEKLSVMPENGSVRVIDDIHKLHNIMVKRFPELPFFIFGHSMGSFCARIYSAQFGEDLAGAIYCGTGELPASVCLLEKPVELVAKALGPEKKYKFLTKMFCKASNLGIKYPRTQSDWLSVNQENVDKYIADPLCGDDFSLGLIRDLIKFASEASAFDWAYKLPTGLPVFIISGAKDPVGLFGIGVQATFVNLQTAGLAPQMKLYPDARHEILNEDVDVREQVYFDVLQWLINVLMSKNNIAEVSVNNA